MARLEDIEAVASPVLTHRVITNFAAESQGMTSKKVVAAARRGNAGRVMQALVPMLPDRALNTTSSTPTSSRGSAPCPLEARLPMIGNVAGKHRSPHRGSSVEFAEYRKYVAGDDTRRLDWKAFARSRPLLHQGIRGRHQPARLLRGRLQRLDELRRPASPGPKIEYARRIAATLGLPARQPGRRRRPLGAAPRRSTLEIPPSRRPAQLQHIFDTLADNRAQGRKPASSTPSTPSPRRSASAPSSSSSPTSSPTPRPSATPSSTSATASTTSRSSTSWTRQEIDFDFEPPLPLRRSGGRHRHRRRAEPHRRRIPPAP